MVYHDQKVLTELFPPVLLFFSLFPALLPLLFYLSVHFISSTPPSVSHSLLRYGYGSLKHTMCVRVCVCACVLFTLAVAEWPKLAQ